MVDSVRREENNQIKNDFVQLRLSHETYSSVIDIFVESGQVVYDNLTTDNSTTDNSTSGRSPNESSNQTQAQIHIEVNVSKGLTGLSKMIERLFCFFYLLIKFKFFNESVNFRQNYLSTVSNSS